MQNATDLDIVEKITYFQKDCKELYDAIAEAAGKLYADGCLKHTMKECEDLMCVKNYFISRIAKKAMNDL